MKGWNVEGKYATPITGQCPMCEGNGCLPELAHETMLRALADKMGYRLSKKPEERQPAHDWKPVIEALSAARESLGFGPAVYTGSSRQRAQLAAGTVAQWLVAIASQRDSLKRAVTQGRLTKPDASTYLSLQTISRNWERCLQNASQAAPKLRKLDDGRWCEETPGQPRRILTPDETRSLGLQET